MKFVAPRQRSSPELHIFRFIHNEESNQKHLGNMFQIEKEGKLGAEMFDSDPPALLTFPTTQ